MRHIRQGEGVSFTFPFPSFVRRGEGEVEKGTGPLYPTRMLSPSGGEGVSEQKVVHA